MWQRCDKGKYFFCVCYDHISQKRVWHVWHGVWHICDTLYPPMVKWRSFVVTPCHTPCHTFSRNSWQIPRNPVGSSRILEWWKSIWTPSGLSSPVDSSGLQSTQSWLMWVDLAVERVNWSPLEWGLYTPPRILCGVWVESEDSEDSPRTLLRLNSDFFWLKQKPN